MPVVFTDSDWGSERDGYSRAGWVAELGGGAVSWKSKKLNLVALSSAEAEYKALGEGAKDAIWFRQLYRELEFPLSPVTLFCDNQAAISLSKNPVHSSKTRHFRLSWHFIRQAQKDREVVVEFVPTAIQDADILTKALSGPSFKQAAARLGMQLDEP